jgi:hypothetical protein
MPLLPQPMNDRYRGSVAAAWFLAVVGVLTVLPGCVHVFLPDGGAGMIAGIELGACGPIVIALFAWAGATQIAFGAMMLLVALRHRPLVPATLALVLVERSLHAVDGWWLKTGSGHHPPEHYAVLVTVPLLGIALAASLRDRAS